MRSYSLFGRIDELDTINTPELLREYLLDVGSDEEESQALRNFDEFCLVYQPLGLSGQFTVKGIEGNMEEDEEYVDFPLTVTPGMTVFNIMEAAWTETERVAWPDVNHVWFEGLDIDEENRVLQFSMGS